MNDILLIASDIDTLERICNVIQKNFALLGNINFSWKKYKKRRFCYLGFKLNKQKIKQQKVQIERDQLHTLCDFQKCLSDINWL